ncbi:magnesium transporter CorA family protein [Pseudalkalibacillus caeni]|uniref:Magnesium transporter CorA n=1 Tax=Exobacillus caeni TaxID=2574798 RepID=A0A5R9EY56_9BACL|nr:magnesium transporter CorA family protein [Pseudalkalibacillus caeni]TLS35429.1 hypothetical protein FCL54_20235 [Pseudalkalibacillus caeni]
MMRYNFTHWEWYDFDHVDQVEQEKNLLMRENVPEWIKKVQNQREIVSHVDFPGQRNAVMYGSLHINYADKEKNNIVYVYIENNLLITVGMDFSKVKTIDKKSMIKEMDFTDTAPKGFLRIIGEILNSFLIELHPTGEHIKLMHEKISQNKRANHLDQIYKFRFKLLKWDDLNAALKDLQIALQEAFLDQIDDTQEFKYIQKRIQRLDLLNKNYEKDLDTLRDLNNGLVSYRGNEIMKTLTVFTVLITPISALGALWGMNFKYMPELDWKWGYLFALITIVTSSGIIFGWLHKKGWTGNILRGRKKNSYTK